MSRKQTLELARDAGTTFETAWVTAALLCGAAGLFAVVDYLIQMLAGRTWTFPYVMVGIAVVASAVNFWAGDRKAWKRFREDAAAAGYSQDDIRAIEAEARKLNKEKC